MVALAEVHRPHKLEAVRGDLVDWEVHRPAAVAQPLGRDTKQLTVVAGDHVGEGHSVGRREGLGDCCKGAVLAFYTDLGEALDRDCGRLGLGVKAKKKTCELLGIELWLGRSRTNLRIAADEQHAEWPDLVKEEAESDSVVNVTGHIEVTHRSYSTAMELLDNREPWAQLVVLVVLGSTDK